MDKLRARNGRDMLHKEKQKVDSNKLQLQNLLYEADHLKKEVQRCYQFKSQDEEIELVPVDEFYESAPANISRPEKTKKDEHAQRLARLEWELEQRKELDSKFKELQSTKKQIGKQIVSKTDRLYSLKPQLEKLLEATRPLQDALNMKLEEKWKVMEKVRFLPNPLYLLYANMCAYAEAVDPLVVTMIDGDEEDVKRDNEPKEVEVSAEPVEDTAHDSENDDNEADIDAEAAPKKRHHHGRVSRVVTSTGQKSDSLFKPHSMSIKTTINTKEKGTGITVTFQYLPILNIITVKVELINIDVTGVAASDVLSADTILNCLYPNDTGYKSPNPRNKYQLEEHDFKIDDLTNLLTEKQLGRPYIWAQQACGLDFVNAASSSSGTSHHLCESTVPQIVKQIRARLHARVRLYKQIASLEQGKLEAANKHEDKILRISGQLVQWTSISFDEYAAIPAAAKFVDDTDTDSPDLFYRAIITRGSAKLECYVKVSVNFPEMTPLWALVLNWNGKHDSTNDSSLKEIEYIVNTIDINKKSRIILPFQLKRLMSGLDVYLETESAFSGSNEFIPDKSYLRAFRGRQRARPFKAVSNGAGIIYTQI